MKKIQLRKKSEIKDLLINENPEPFNVKEWLKAAKALQKAIKRENEKIRKGLEEFEDNDSKGLPAY